MLSKESMMPIESPWPAGVRFEISDATDGRIKACPAPAIAAYSARVARSWVDMIRRYPTAAMSSPAWTSRSSPHRWMRRPRSEEHTSELQSPCNLVCRLLLEKKNDIIQNNIVAQCASYLNCQGLRRLT